MACFHAPQAIREGAERVLVHGAIQFRKTHDLVVLVVCNPNQFDRSSATSIFSDSSNGQWMHAARPTLRTSRPTTRSPSW